MKIFSFALLLHVVLLIHVLLPSSAWAKVPDAELTIASSNNQLMRASYGNFGSRASITDLELQPTPSVNDNLLCMDYNSNPPGNNVFYPSNVLLLVPRGICSFELKLYNALNMGAAGIVIYNTLESRYSYNDTLGLLRYPEPKNDYDCDTYGQTVLEQVPFEFDPPGYNGTLMDPFVTMTSDENICTLDKDNCPSQRCLMTAKVGTNSFQACCAWDMHVSMSGDANLNFAHTDDGIAVFITMEQSDVLRELLQSGDPVYLHMAPRPFPRFNASSFLLWALATALVYFSSWYSAQDYRWAKYKLTHPEQEEDEVEMISMTAPTVVAIPNEDREGVAEPFNDDHSTVPATAAAPMEPFSTTSDVTPPPTSSFGISVDPLAQSTAPPAAALMEEPSLDHQQAPPQPLTPARRRAATPTTNSTAPRIESMELTMWHAGCFVVVASAMLMLLFFFEFYTAVTVLYGIGCSGAMAQLIFRPLYSRILVSLGNKYQCFGEQSLCPTVLFCGCNEIALLDVLAGVSGYTIGAAWLYVWFTSLNPSGNVFYWVTQDIMGACICILFLSILRLNNIKVATVLLIAVFLYDIFFVFLTPYLFDGDSVMVTVATGGGPSDQVSADYCEKYPTDADCREGQPLPMLLTLPKIDDFRGGANLLGLGDIVLPGLLTSFAARLDGAKMLVGGHTSLDVSPKPPRGGYLLYLTFAYAVGLLMAMIAVALMERGQPALLYLVPTTLGTMLWLTRSELKEMWKGPRVLKWADRLVRYCDSHRFAVTPGQFGDAATEAGSIDEEDDVVEVEHDLELNDEEHDETKDRYEDTEVLGIVMENGSNRELT